MEIKHAFEKDDLENAFSIRKLVFVEEKGVPLEDEFDEYDEYADHIIIYYDNKPAAAGRLRIIDEEARLERICVRVDFRKLGLGIVVVQALEGIASKKGLKKVKLHALLDAKEFYEKLGYIQGSDEFIEVGIPHVLMVKNL